MPDETIQAEEKEEEEVCTCGHFLGSHACTPINKQPAKAGAIDASFVHLPAHLSQPGDGSGSTGRKRFVPFSLAASSTFYLESQHLHELNLAAQSGGDGVQLCADCVNR